MSTRIPKHWQSHMHESEPQSYFRRKINDDKEKIELKAHIHKGIDLGPRNLHRLLCKGLNELKNISKYTGAKNIE